MSITRLNVAAPAASLLLLLALFAPGCENHKFLRENARPSVHLIWKPQGAQISYAARFQWEGSDPDGRIDHYQYAIDVPDSIPLERLNDPNYTGVHWTNTDSTAAVFLFSTPALDTLSMGDSTIVFTDVYVGDHNLFVRSVDNDGAPSPVDYVEFTAENVAPKSRITVGEGDCPVDLTLLMLSGGTVQVNLAGTDPDRPGPDKKPAWFEWKVVPIDYVFQHPDPYFVINVRGADIAWNRVSADSATLLVPLLQHQDQYLAVRAIDVQGAVERRFEVGRNVAAISQHASNGLSLMVNERALGKASFEGSNPVQADVPAGITLNFDLFAGGPTRGDEITGYCVTVDPEDPANPPCAWNSSSHASVTLTSPGQHSIVFQAKDCLGDIVRGTLQLNAVSIPRDRDVLYVDDVLDRSSIAMPDAQMDDRFQSLIREAGPFTDVYQFDAFGPGDANMIPAVPGFADLARYRLVVWATNAVAYNSDCALVEAAVCGFGRPLAMYMASGGSVWISGQSVAGALTRDSRYQSCRSFLSYTDTSPVPLIFTCPGFGCDFLGLSGGEFRTVADSRTNGLIQAMPTAKAAGELFPPVEMDSTVVRLTLGGIPHYDADFVPIVRPPGLDTLYTATQTVKSTSIFRNKPIAFRYADPDPVPGQGPAAVTFIPLHWLKQGSAADRTGVKGMARSMFEWFRSQQMRLP